MRKMRLHILMLQLLLLCYSADAQWTRKKDVGGQRDRWSPYTFTLNNKVYVGAGYGNQAWANDLWEYDPTTDMWKQKNDLPNNVSNRSAGVSFTINGKAYIGLGAENYLKIDGSAKKLNDLWEYDAANDKWTRKQDLPDSGRSGAAVFVAKGKAYIVAGENKKSGMPTDEVWEYDPAVNKWTKKTPYPGGVTYNATSFALNDKCYVLGGLNSDGTLYEYNATTDKWTKKGAFADSARIGAISFVHNGTAYVGLGSKGSVAAGEYPVWFYAYHPSTDGWELVSQSFPGSGRAYAAVQVLNGKVYIGAGWKFLNGQTFYRDWYEGDIAAILGIRSNDTHETKMTIYPNPAHSEIFVSVPDMPTDAYYTLYGITGVSVLSGVLPGTGKIDIRNIPQGQYIVEVSSGTQKFRKIAVINR